MRPFIKWEAYSSATTKELQTFGKEIGHIGGSAANGIYKRTLADQVHQGKEEGIRCSLCLSTFMASLDPLMCLQISPNRKL